jgi:hypothetical protein
MASLDSLLETAEVGSMEEAFTVIKAWYLREEAAPWPERAAEGAAEREGWIE